MLSRLVFFAVAAGSVSALSAGTVVLPNCPSDTLANYIANYTAFPSGGCAIGILDYYTFSYHNLSNAPTASQIEVSMSTTGKGFSFTRVDGTPFTAAPGQTVQFEIDFNNVIDPAPIISNGDLNLDPPSGNVSITEFYCNDSPYVFQATCFGGYPGSPETLTVTTANPTKSLAFTNPATRFQDVGILFTLIGGTTGASFDGLDSNTTVISIAPEPAAAGSLLFGLLALGSAYKLRKQRAL